MRSSFFTNRSAIAFCRRHIGSSSCASASFGTAASQCVEPMTVRFLFALCLSCVCASAHADIILSASTPRLAPGGVMALQLTITNETSAPATIEIPSPLHLRLETSTAVSIIDAAPDRSGAIVVPPNGFVVVRLSAAAPAVAEGSLTVTPTGLQANVLALIVDSATPRTDALVASETSAATEPPKPDEEARLVDKPPPLAVSVYEP